MSPKRFTSFQRDENGTVAIIFALSLVVLTLSLGLAVDYSRALAYYDRTQVALDAASLAVSKAAGEGRSEAELEQLAQIYFDQAMRGQTGVSAKLGKLGVKVDPDTMQARVEVSGSVGTVVGKIIGIDSIQKDLLSAAISSNKNIELGMMLDVSGSMEGSKLRSLKQASKDLIDTLTSGGSNARKARIGLVPYSTSVNLGTYGPKAKGNGNNNGHGNGRGNSGRGRDRDCVSERTGIHAFTDAPPGAGRMFGNEASDCPDTAIMPLSDDKEALNAAIDAMEADGSTAGHLGVAWAWYMVSQKWQSFWPEASAPADADPKKLLKAVVLMTDGMFNKQYENENGRSAAQASKLCANMKADGIMVFTVAFDAPDEVLPLFAQCASLPAYAFNAKDGKQLRKSFARIGQYLSDLRIAQ